MYYRVDKGDFVYRWAGGPYDLPEEYLYKTKKWSFTGDAVEAFYEGNGTRGVTEKEAYEVIEREQKRYEERGK